MRTCVLLIALALSTAVWGALPGVTELRSSPEAISDVELAQLLHAPVASADVVALGETVHGSAGFLRLQTRLIRYLVERHGFRLIVWENPALRSLEFSRWVASCTKAKSPPPIGVLYMPTASDLPLWDWVCGYNHANKDRPVIFRGMDIWDRPWEHFARIAALGARTGADPALLRNIAACPAYGAASWREIEAVYAQAAGNGRFLPETAYETCRRALSTLLDASRRSGIEKKKSGAEDADDAFELAISASTMLGWLGFYNDNWSDDVLSWNARDMAQGRNLMLVMEKHGAARAILAAHTSHVSHNRSPADWWGYGDLKSGVHFFTALTGRRVFNIAFTAYEASGTQGAWSLPTAVNSVDKKLHDAGHAFAYFASNARFLAERPKWWIQNQNFPGRYESGVELVPADHFDAFFFFGQSHLDEALPQRPMWEP